MSQRKRKPRLSMAIDMRLLNDDHDETLFLLCTFSRDTSLLISFPYYVVALVGFNPRTLTLF